MIAPKTIARTLLKPQTSLAPLSWFHGSRVTTAHVHQYCIFQNYANEIDYEIDDAWPNIQGIHDNGPRDHSVWRLTLTAYNFFMVILDPFYSYQRLFVNFIPPEKLINLKITPF